MPDYRLSNAAKGDLIGIARHGDEHFGRDRSDRYRHGIVLSGVGVDDNGAGVGHGLSLGRLDVARYGNVVLSGR